MLRIMSKIPNNNIQDINCWNSCSNWMFNRLLTYVTGGCDHALPKLVGAAYSASLPAVSGSRVSYFLMKIAFN